MRKEKDKEDKMEIHFELRHIFTYAGDEV